jgi:hypothetical protein
VLLLGLTSGFVDRVSQNEALPAETRTAIATQAEASGLQVVPVDTVYAAAVEGGLTADQATAIATDYGDAQLEGLRNALGAVALISVLGFAFTRRIPDAPTAPEPAPAPAEAVATA